MPGILLELMDIRRQAERGVLRERTRTLSIGVSQVEIEVELYTLAGLHNDGGAIMNNRVMLNLIGLWNL